MGLAASAAILATGHAAVVARITRRRCGHAGSRRARVASRCSSRPRRPAEHNFTERFTGASFADRFAGAPLWETSYATARTETRATGYASGRGAQPRRCAPRDAVASRAPGFQLASASADVVVPSQPRARSMAEPPARSTDSSRARARPPSRARWPHSASRTAGSRSTTSPRIRCTCRTATRSRRIPASASASTIRVTST